MPVTNYVLTLLLASSQPAGQPDAGITLGADAVTQPVGGASKVCYRAVGKDLHKHSPHVAVKTISWSGKHKGHNAQFVFQKRGLHELKRHK